MIASNVCAAAAAAAAVALGSTFTHAQTLFSPLLNRVCQRRRPMGSAVAVQTADTFTHSHFLSKSILSMAYTRTEKSDFMIYGLTRGCWYKIGLRPQHCNMKFSRGGAKIFMRVYNPYALKLNSKNIWRKRIFQQCNDCLQVHSNSIWPSMAFIFI